MSNPHQETHPNPNEYFPLKGTLGAPGEGAEIAALLANLLAAVAALALAAGAFFFPHADCTPLSIEAVTAQMEAAVHNLDPEDSVFWFLVPGSDIRELPPFSEDELKELTEDISQLTLTNLTPGTEYTLVFLTRSPDGTETLLHTFSFRTPEEPPAEPPKDPEPPSDPPQAPPRETTPPAESPPQPTQPPTEPPTEPPARPPAVPTQPPAAPPADRNPPPPPKPPLVPADSQAPGMHNYVAPNRAEETNGSYDVVFSFGLKGGTMRSIELNGSIYGPSQDAPASIAISFDTASPYVSVGADGTVTLTYPITDASSQVSLTATLHYTDANGTNGSLASTPYQFYPAYLYGGGTTRNTVNYTIDGEDLVCTLTLLDYTPGSCGYRITEVEVKDSSTINGAILKPDFTANVSTDRITVAFRFPYEQFRKTQDSRSWAELLFTVTGDCYYNGMPMNLVSWSQLDTTIPLDGTLLTVGPVSFTPESDDFYGMHFDGVQFSANSQTSASLSDIAPNDLVTMTLSFSGEATETFYIYFTFGDGSMIRDTSNGAMLVEKGDTKRSRKFYFNMQDTNVTNEQIQLARIYTQPYTAASTFAWLPSEVTSTDETMPSLPPAESSVNTPTDPTAAITVPTAPPTEPSVPQTEPTVPVSAPTEQTTPNPPPSESVSPPLEPTLPSAEPSAPPAVPTETTAISDPSTPSDPVF